MMARTRRSVVARWMRRALVLGAVALLLKLGGGWLLPAAGQALDISQPPIASDEVLVLGGNPASRPLVAAALVRSGLAQRVLIPTVYRDPAQANRLVPPEHEIMKRILIARGVDARDIIQLPGEVTSTLDEATALARYLEGRPNDTVTVVTTSWHTRRARWTLQRVLGARAGQLRFVAAPPEGYDATNWWRTEKGRVHYFREFIKLATAGSRL